MEIKSFFDQKTATLTYVLYESDSGEAVIIDPVLGYDHNSGTTDVTAADEVIAFIKERNLLVRWILETHVHADHLTASCYLKKHLGGKTAIGSQITRVLNFWVPIFNSAKDTPLDGSQFDVLLHHHQALVVGNHVIQVLYTPGHTPVCCSFLVQDAVFVGDTLFMPDIGTARTDFPGGNAGILYDSIQKLFQLPEDIKVYVGHDYPVQGREVCWMSSLRQQKESNILASENISRQEFIQKRQERDLHKPVPQLLLPALQVNLRAGSFGLPEENGFQYIKIPVNGLGRL